MKGELYMNEKNNFSLKASKLNSKVSNYLYFYVISLFIIFSGYILLFKSNTSNLIKIISVIGIILSLICIFLLLSSLKSMLSPVNLIAEYAKTISKGELGLSDIVTNDKSSIGELAKAFNNMKSNLLLFIEQTKSNILVISESVEKMSKSTEISYKGNEQIASTIQEISSKTQQQLELVKSTADNLKDISIRVDNILSSIKDTENLTMNTSNNTKKGIESINEYNKQINIISSDLKNTYDFINKLRDSIKEITGIVDFITNISEQLKMLALNASIEAARAGEAGRGFAVVATETTKLSDAAKDGTIKINNLINSIMDNSNFVEKSIEECINNFDKGNQIFLEVKNIFNNISKQSDTIINSMNLINEEAAQINQHAKETTLLSESLYNASKAVTSSTEEVAAIVEEGVAGLQEINASSNNLSSMLKKIEKLALRFNTSVKPIDKKPSKQLKLGVICPSNAEFWNSIKQGIMYAKRELLNRNTKVDLIEIQDTSVENFNKALEDMINNGYDGISVVGYYKEMAAKINKATNKGIAVATFNGDIPDSNRLVFVGQNPYSAGNLAGEMMLKEIKENGKIGIITSSFNINDHQLRIKGFKDSLSKGKNFNILFEDEAHDNDDISYKKAKQYLEKNKDLNGIFIAAGGISGVAKVVEEMGLRGKVKIICFDFIDSTLNYIKKGVISCSIGQDPFGQGYSPLIYLYNYIVDNKKPESDKVWTRMDVVNSENVDNMLF